MRYDEIGPEMVVRVYDPETGMRGILVIDNSYFGPAGGGTRMAVDVTEDEVGDLARAMTYKYAVNGLPTGGSKAGIVGDPNLPPEQKNVLLRAFGRALAPMLRSVEEGWFLGVGPDMGLDDSDVDTIYEGAERPNVTPGFAGTIEGDPPWYHLPGSGVVAAARSALTHIGRSLEGATFALEGFGQMGGACARYASRDGAKIVAVTTISGGVHDPKGLDIPKLLELRRVHGDDCVLRYEGGQQIARGEIYYLPCDVLVPGARPYVLHGRNEQQVTAKIICPAGNIALTEEAEERMHQRGVVVVPDFVASSGGTISTWTSFLGQTPEQGLANVRRLIEATTTRVLTNAATRGMSPPAAARNEVRTKILGGKRRRITFAEATRIGREVLGA